MEQTNPTPVPAWPASAAVVGAGTMGLGIAESLATAGVPVRLAEETAELGRAARERLLARVRGHVAAGLLPPEALDRAGAVEAADAATAARGVDLVIEAVPERLDLKRDVLAAVAAAAPPEAVVATNTSSFPIDDLAAAVARPERFLGTHWFNPPEWTPGVEVIPGAATDPRIVDRVVAFLAAIGKRPAVVRSGPGFVANRIQNALFLEAVACVEEGLASPREVDEIVRGTFGFRLPFFGPFQIADMAGLDVYADVLATLERGLGDPFRVPALLRSLVEGGRIGTKGGAGFYAYTAEEREQLLGERDRRYAALAALLAGLPPITPPPEGEGR